MAVTGATLEEMVVDTARVISAGALPLLAGVRGQTARLTAVVLGVPEAALVVTVVVTTDETLTTVTVMLAVSLPRLTHLYIVPHTAVFPTSALHLEALHLLGIHHDGQGRLPRGGVFQEGELEKGLKKIKKKIGGLFHVVIREKTHFSEKCSKWDKTMRKEL